MQTRRQWLRTAALGPSCLTLLAARKEFWESKDPAAWSDDEKRTLLEQSPWAREGAVNMEIETGKRKTVGYGNNGRPGGDMPDTRPGVPPGGVRSVPIGEKPPPVPDPNAGRPVQFRAMARWETAKPVGLAGAPQVPELSGQFYVIRLRGLPLLPPKANSGEAPPNPAAPNPNAALLDAIRDGSSLERKDKPPIRCDHLFTGSGNQATEVLLFFPRGRDAITPADKVVTLESRFTVFHLSIRFPLKDMMFQGKLAL